MIKEGRFVKLPGNCLTTAMGILPHVDPEAALRLALSLNIPFWPQLPRLSFYEDMYTQVSEHLPGIKLDFNAKVIRFNVNDFYEELPAYIENWEDPDYFHLSPQYARVYRRFLAEDLAAYPAIRGQSIGPVSYGLKIIDEKQAPIIYNDEVRGFLYDFIAKKIQAQYRDLVAKNIRAFVWIDEPGLELVFMAVTGYSSERAWEDYRHFLAMLPGPKGVHLCGNPDWSFLLGLELDIISLDALQWGHIFTRYTGEVKEFLQKGGIISWGITPTLTEEVEKVTIEKLVAQLENLWDYLNGQGISKETIITQAWLAPARCCLVNADGTASVEKSFRLLKEVAGVIRKKYGLL